MMASSVVRYAFRLAFGQPASNASLSASGNCDRVITRSATCLALLGIALSSFSLKQMLSSSGSTSSRVPFRKF